MSERAPKPTEAATRVRAVRTDLANTLEDVGATMTLLREAADFAAGGNLCMARSAGADALDLICSLEVKHSDLAARLAMWCEWTEGGAA